MAPFVQTQVDLTMTRLMSSHLPTARTRASPA